MIVLQLLLEANVRTVIFVKHLVQGASTVRVLATQVYTMCPRMCVTQVSSKHCFSYLSLTKRIAIIIRN